jgi:hypothetical protein
MSAMRRRSPLVRTSWLVATGLQLALPGAAAWADAHLDVVEAHAVAHVESHTTKSCARIHPPDCALCHLLTAPALMGRTMLLRLDVADARIAGAPEHTAPPRLTARPHPQPRAPPALS